MAGFFNTLSGKRVAFIGAGVSHRALIPMFAAAGAEVSLCDVREESLFDKNDIKTYRRLGVCLFLGKEYLSGLAGQDMILRTPGFDWNNEYFLAAGRAGTRLTSEIELFFEHCPCKTLGVTGSDGKTTTTSLIAAMYKAAGRTVHLGGNIGRALLPIVDDIERGDIAVVELSSFQLITMRCSPNMAVVTNLAENHLDHHRDMDEYIDAKRNILAWQGPDDKAVLNYENTITRGMQKDIMGELRWFSPLRQVRDGAFLDEAGNLCLATEGQSTPVVHKSKLMLRGSHNVENMLAALATVRDAVPLAAMQQVAHTFAGVEHRIEPVRMLNGVQWYNDSIATSPTRVIAGLRAFNQKLIVIAGGHDKNLSFAPMVPDMLQRVKLLILTGATASKIEAVLRANPAFDDSGLVILRAGNMAEAVRLAHEHAGNGDIVTLSPACAASDAYDNFEARGRHFKQLVNAL